LNLEGKLLTLLLIFVRLYSLL